MRRRRRPNKNNEPEPAPKTGVKEYKEPVLLVTYKDECDIVRKSVLPFGKEYIENESYKENFEDACYIIYTENGGFWVDEQTIIPSSRILSISMIEESKPQKKENRVRTPNKNKPTKPKKPPVKPPVNVKTDIKDKKGEV